MTDLRAVAAAILTAGESRRMGSPKALLDAGDGTTFLERIAGLARGAGLRRILAVVRAGDAPVRAAAERANVAIVESAAPELGPIGSIRTALDVLEPEGFEALLSWPVDSPCVAPATLAKLLAARRPDGPPIVVPVHDGRRGHPVLLGRAVWDELRGPEAASEGARAVVRREPDRVLGVPVDDPGVLLDIDTRRAYRRLRKGRNRASPG